VPVRRLEEANQDLTGTASAERAGAEESRTPAKQELSDEKAAVLAALTAKLSENEILRCLRDKPSHRLPLAVPTDARSPECTDMLDTQLGMVLLCEAVDAFGWAFGKVLAPARLAGQRGCFLCKGMHPLLAELRMNHLGAGVEYVPSAWDRLVQTDGGTQGRLRQKALLARLKAARSALAKTAKTPTAS